MPRFKIALLPGDGIGPEVVASAVRVLDAAVQNIPAVELAYTEYSVGAAEYLKNGDPLPSETVEALKAHDAILLGAMGLPSVRWPNGVEMTPQIDLREQLDLYQGIRPIKLYHLSHSPLNPVIAQGIDFILVRENCEGLFAARKEQGNRSHDLATDTMRITRHGAERISRAAFKLAEKRRKRVTLVDKANVLPSMAFFREVFDEVAKEFPAVETDHVYVDAMALFLVQKPAAYDVLVTENMFGDILSDLAAGLVGGMGMAPSADLGDTYGLFQPSHGTAPTIAGKGIANPVATIVSAAMMLEYLGHEDLLLAAQRIKRAVALVLADPSVRTADLGGAVTTADITARIIKAL